MTVFCTYCTAEKDLSESELPSFQRYQGARLQAVYAAAERLGLKFLILSGKYGILKPGDPIQHYNHLLKASEVKTPQS